MRAIISIFISSLVIITPPAWAAPTPDVHKQVLQSFRKFKTVEDIVNDLAKTEDAKEIQWLKSELKDELKSPAPEVSWRGSQFQIKLKSNVLEFKVSDTDGIIEINGKELDLLHLTMKDRIQRIREIYENPQGRSGFGSLFFPEAHAFIFVAVLAFNFALWAVAGATVYYLAKKHSKEKAEAIAAAAVKDLNDAKHICETLPNSPNAKPLTELPGGMATGAIHGVTCARQKFPTVCDSLTALRKCLTQLQQKKARMPEDDVQEIETLLAHAKQSLEGEATGGAADKQVIKAGAPGATP